jgi:hypothetical protein
MVGFGPPANRQRRREWVFVHAIDDVALLPDEALAFAAGSS